MRREEFFYGYTVTAAGFAIWFIGWGTYGTSFSVFLKPLLTEFGWSRAETSLAYSLASIVQAISGIMMGWLTDRLGPRFVIMVLGSFLGICYLLCSQVTTLWQFQLSYAVMGGFGVSTLAIPVMATVSRWFIKKRSLMIGVVQAGMGIGGFIIPPFTGWLILSHGWRFAYIVLGVINLIGILAAGFFLRRDPRDKGQLPDGELQLSHPAAEMTQVPVEVHSQSLKEPIRRSPFWIMVGLYGIFGFCRSTLMVHVPAHVQDLGFSLADGANVLAVVIGASLFGRIGLGRVADRIGNEPVFMMSFAVMTVSLVWGILARELWMVYVFAFIFGVCWGNQAVLRYSMAAEVFGKTSLGFLIGILSFAESITSALGSYFAGYVYDVFGHYSPAFWTIAGASAGGILLVRSLRIAVKREETLSGHSKIL